MDRRSTLLHEDLCELLSNCKVYFDSPTTVSMTYPAVRYKLSGKDLKRANNKIYRNTNRYDGVVITRDADSPIPDIILEHFEMSSFGTPYTANNLHHFPFTIYY